MIDEKKIEEAAIAFDNKAEWAEDADAQAIVQYSFKAGANWALQEFKKSLWHDASEEPKKGSKILYKDGRGFHEWDIQNDIEWKTFVKYFNISRWCYIDYILPKEGGEQ